MLQKYYKYYKIKQRKEKEKMAKTNERNYSAEIIKKGGSLDNSVFTKMVVRGDVTATPVKEMLNESIIVSGYADVHIKTSENDFTMLYVNTDKGMICTGSDIFRNSLMDYIDDVNTFRIVSVKCKKGIAYKLMPTFETSVETSDDTEIPFN